MSRNQGYDAVVDVDIDEVIPSSTSAYPGLITSQGDLGHTDLQEDDLEFHSSSLPRRTN